MRSMRAGGWLLVVVLALVAGGCASFKLFRPAREIQPQTVGVVLPLSGKYKLVGDAALEGIRLALEGSEVRLVVRDSKGEPEAARAALESLSQEGAIAVLGGVARDEARAAAERADELGIPFLTFSQSEDATEPGNFVFRNMTTLRAQAKAIARHATCELGYRRFAILAPETEFGRSLAEAFTEAVRAAGGDVRQHVTYPPQQTTFTHEARLLTGRAEPEKREDFLRQQREIQRSEMDATRKRRALEKARASLPPVVGFEALFLPDEWKTVSLIAPALAVEDLVTTACDARDLERIRKTIGRDQLATATLLGWGGWSSPVGQGGVPELLARGGKYMHCSIYVDGFHAQSNRPATRDFVKAFQRANGGRIPNLLHAVAFDSARVFRDIIERARPDSSGAFHRHLENVAGFEGATGPISLDSDRSQEVPSFLLQIVPSGLRELPATGDCRSPVAAVAR